MVPAGAEPEVVPSPVPIYQEGEEVSSDPEILKQAEAIFTSGSAVAIPGVKEQLAARTTCELTLPTPGTKKLDGREVWASARKGFLRVGTYYLCTKCKKWHLDLSCGFFITADGAAATAYHVVEPDKTMKRGCLVAVDDGGKVFPVTEILAASKSSDVCILRVACEATEPLPLSEDARPGDKVYCFSDPNGERSYFSGGMVNRVVSLEGEKAGSRPTRVLDVSTEWAPGSSGAAVLDECANAIGLVSTIAPIQEDEAQSHAKKQPFAGVTWMVIHEAVSAYEVRALVNPPGAVPVASPVLPPPAAAEVPAVAQ